MAGEELHPHSADLNEMQDATLHLICLMRKQIDERISVSSADEEVKTTLKRLLHYMACRSQSASYLLSSGFPWDSEIILRSFYESCAKISLICFSGKNERKELVREFWGLYALTHDHQRKVKVRPAVDAFTHRGETRGERVLGLLLNETVFPSGETDKKTRKALSQKWSFTEIVRSLASRDDLPGMMEMQVLLHMYGQQSHLIHADDAALDLMLDRASREPSERHALEAGHASRIMSDQASLWVLSLIGVSHIDQISPAVPKDIAGAWEKQQGIGRKLFEVFYESQESFYQDFT